MRDGDRVSVKASTAMPGVEDGAVLHVEWGPRLATLVGAGRFRVLEERPAAVNVDLDVAEPAGATTAVAAGDVDEQPRRQRRPRPR